MDVRSIIGAVAIFLTANAATAASIDVLVQTQATANGLIAFLPQDLKVGDCRSLHGNSWVQISFPVNGFSLVVWRGSASTVHTNNADIWHQQVQALDMSFGLLGEAPIMDGDPMRLINKTYVWDRAEIMRISPDRFFSMLYMKWRISC